MALQSEQVDFAEWKKELYNPQSPGMIHIPGFLNDETRLKVMKEIQTNSSMFEKEPNQVGKVYEDMETIYFGHTEKQGWPISENFPQLRLLLESYTQVYSSFATDAGFSLGKIGSVGIHHYNQGVVGITPHVDPPHYVNLVSIFVMEGKAPFGVCKDREYSGKVEVMTKPGDLLLLRAPRTIEEISMRPFHYVGKIEEERWAILMRQVGKL